MSYPVRLYYDPFTEFDRLFEDAFVARFSPSGTAVERGQSTNNNERQQLFRPRMDVHENKDTNTITATFELPGLNSEDVSIEVHQNRLTVSGEFHKTESREEEGYAIRERRQGKFSRTIQLPVGVKPEDVKAKMENGLLDITFPKATPEQQPHRITIS
ncbi:small heat shock protein [Scleroderma citrinum]